MRRAALFALAAALALAPLPRPAAAKPLVADISSHDINIRTSFEGEELMLFGARNDPGDIVVVVRGPERNARVRRKERVAGVWVNRKKESFDRIPAFYALASSRPFEEIEKSAYFQALGIDDFSALLPFKPPVGLSYGSARHATAPDREASARALIEHLREARLYAAHPGKVTFIGQTLFKTVIPFPDNTPRGTYTAEVYLFSDGNLVAAHATPIRVYKSGFDAFVYDAAQHRPYLYGIASILLAALAGIGAGMVFQRV